MAVTKDPVSPKSTLSEREGMDLVPVSQTLPPNITLLPVSQSTLFPGMVIPVILPEGKLATLVEKSLGESQYVGVVLLKEPSDTAVATGPTTSISGLPLEGTTQLQTKKAKKNALPFYQFGVAAKILKKINLPDNQLSVLLSGIQRFRIQKVVAQEPYFVASVEYLEDELVRDTELEALLRSTLSQFKAVSKDNPLISEEVKVAMINIDGPGRLSDFLGSVLIRDVKDYQDLLGTKDVKDRLHKLLLLLKKEQEVQAVQKQISDEINAKVASSQREFYLQEQLKLIQKELGKAPNERARIQENLREKLQGKTLGKEAKERIEDEFEKLGSLSEQSSEYSVAINYLDWAVSLPWGVNSSEKVDLRTAKKVLDEDHYGLKEVKERILEFLAVRSLKKNQEGSILCLVGPPGTGKTSLGKSIAKTLGRKFFRFSVGGMRDESEIKGHRRTYVGAMPGKIIQGLKRVGTQNPVMMIDEIDKIGSGAYSGDPASALLEVLDPEQNGEFLDHYLDIPFDCSKILFITTANTLDTIPAPLLDRMEVIHVSGYTEKEKYQIVRKYLLPKQLAKNGLTARDFSLSAKAALYIIHRYARESGVRNLEKQIQKLCRKLALRLVTGRGGPWEIDTPQKVEKYLGVPHYHPLTQLHEKEYGVASGLAWTSMGGEVLYIESRIVDGKGGFHLTGSLGGVMQESANIAYTFLRQKAAKLKLEAGFFEKHLIHLHVPSGATPKDGPSAGITMCASLYSLLLKKPIPKGIAMTGELTLTGKVLPVGGIKEKLLAAKRAGYKTIILPKSNQRDFRELDSEAKEGLKFKWAESMDQVLKFLFE